MKNFSKKKKKKIKYFSYISKMKNKEVEPDKFTTTTTPEGLTITVEHDSLFDGPLRKQYTTRDKSFLKK